MNFFSWLDRLQSHPTNLYSSAPRADRVWERLRGSCDDGSVVTNLRRHRHLGGCGLMRFQNETLAVFRLLRSVVDHVISFRLGCPQTKSPGGGEGRKTRRCERQKWILVVRRSPCWKPRKQSLVVVSFRLGCGFCVGVFVFRCHCWTVNVFCRHGGGCERRQKVRCRTTPDIPLSTW